MSFSPINIGVSLKVKVRRYMGIGISVYRYIGILVCRYIGISMCKFLPDYFEEQAFVATHAPFKIILGLGQNPCA